MGNKNFLKQSFQAIALAITSAAERILSRGKEKLK